MPRRVRLRACDLNGDEAGKGPLRAYLMASAPETAASFRMLDSEGDGVYSAAIGPKLGTWSHSKSLSYNIYALDFSVPI